MEEASPISSLYHSDPKLPEVVPSPENPSYNLGFGDEENAPENSLDLENLTKLQQKVIKKMRLGGTPYKRTGSRRFSGSDASSSMGSFQSKNQQDSQPLLVDPTSDNAFVSTANTATVLPHKKSATKHWLDDFGRQNNEYFSRNNGYSVATVNASDKDPRFHSKRTLERAEKAIEQDKQLILVSRSSMTENNDPLEERSVLDHQHVLLAPVLGSDSMSTSPWKAPLKESAQVHPYSASKRGSFIEDTNAAIAAAQEAPDLATTSSRDSSSFSAAPSSNTSTSASSMASDLVKRLVNNSRATTTQSPVKPQLTRQSARGTPVRIKPRAHSQDVQATDQGYASVAKLSAWLADDPTSTKKVRHVRRGANVIAKSRRFEKDLEYVIAEENRISSGAVQEKKHWLKTVFSGDCEDKDHNHEYHHHVMRTQPVTIDDSCARSEFVVHNDTGSTISVSNQKRWLQNAFKKERQGFAAGAKSDIGPLREENRDDVTSRAKKMWQEKSEKRLAVGPPKSAQQPSSAMSSPWRKDTLLSASRTTPRKVFGEHSKPIFRSSMGTRASAPPHVMQKAADAASINGTSRHSTVGMPQVEEDKTPVNFCSARETLIQRSKQNGNEVKIVTKVQRRTDKFEKITRESKRRSSSTGLLKPTWSSDSGSEGPSNTYTKKFVEDIAPKRSFDELP